MTNKHDRQVAMMQSIIPRFSQFKLIVSKSLSRKAKFPNIFHQRLVHQPDRTVPTDVRAHRSFCMTRRMHSLNHASQNARRIPLISTLLSTSQRESMSKQMMTQLYCFFVTSLYDYNSSTRADLGHVTRRNQHLACDSLAKSSSSPTLDRC